MYKIIMIDDDPEEFPKIRRTIKENAPIGYLFEEGDYTFEEFNLAQYDNQQDIVKDLLNFIISRSVSLIIIDYKLLPKNNSFSGNKIFAEICKVVSKFPIIILTEKLHESLEGFYVDADKIYEKDKFFQIESNYSKEKVSNLFYNMESYTNNLGDLEEQLALLLGEMQNNAMSLEIINEINNIETELSKYIPLDRCKAEELYNADELKEIINLLAEANKLIKG